MISTPERLWRKNIGNATRLTVENRLTEFSHSSLLTTEQRMKIKSYQEFLKKDLKVYFSFKI